MTKKACEFWNEGQSGLYKNENEVCEHMHLKEKGTMSVSLNGIQSAKTVTHKVDTTHQVTRVREKSEQDMDNLTREGLEELVKLAIDTSP
ncbi:MAG: hypothetical protein KC964_02010, partial [Candidatus Omnitrophica bacterium]|nr:hypothetical protein [Candidatus Omnitrophota bacterium]